MKEKAMAKLSCDRLQSRVDTLETQVKQASRNLSSAGGASVPGSRATDHKSLSPTKTGTKTSDAKTSVLPPDDRPNPFLGVELSVAEAEKFAEKKSFPAHMSSIAAVCAHPSKPVVATASDDCTWKMWSVPNGDLIMTGDGHKDWIAGLDFHPRGSHLATASGDGTVKLWSFAKSKCVATYTEHSQAVWACTFHDGGDFLVSGSMDHTCKLWDVNTGRCRMSLRGHVDSVNSVCFQPFSNNICSSSGDKTVSLWDARSGLCIQTLYGHSNSCNSAAFNLRGDTIVSSDADGGVRIWDIRMVQQRLHIEAGPLPANKYRVTSPSHRVSHRTNSSRLQVLLRPQRRALARRVGRQDHPRVQLRGRHHAGQVSARRRREPHPRARTLSLSPAQFVRARGLRELRLLRLAGNRSPPPTLLAAADVLCVQATMLISASSDRTFKVWS